MADYLYFSRDTKLYLEIGASVWEIPILDGFSYTQASVTEEITLSEATDGSGNSRRGIKYSNTALAPAEWSITTYMRPFKSTGTGGGAADSTANVHHMVEEPLWALIAGPATYSAFNFTGISSDTTDNDIDFLSSNKTTLGTCNLYFVLGACTGSNFTVHKITGAVINEASIDFDLDGIASVTWSGFGATLTTETTAPAATVYEGINSTSNFIRNKLTTLAITGSGTGNFQSTYDVTLTGGNITINNNIEFVTPDELCKVNTPLGHVTGSRTISGNFTAYLVKDTVTPNATGDLFEDLAESTTIVTNTFGLSFGIGGTSATPRVIVAIPNAHLEVPAIGVESVISVDAAFRGLPSTIDTADEITVKYVGA